MVKQHDWSGTGMSWSSLDRGLDLSKPDVTTLQEWEAWRASDRLYRGYPLPSYELLGELGRPDAVKRWFSQIPAFYAPDGGFTTAAIFLHLYALLGFSEGLVYEIDNCESQGMTKAQTSEVLAIAFLHSPSGGMFKVKEAASERMRAYREPEPDRQIHFPEHWRHDEGFWDAGLDYAQPDLTPDERASLDAWYERVTGEVPGYARFLGDFRPRMLKAYRNRLENTMRAMPIQMMPFVQIPWEIFRGYKEGLRDTILLGRGMGMTRDDIINSLVWATLYGAGGSMSFADAAVGDILREDW